eukprot:scaffold564_cov248-Pinguiococcus_pyrenoidosus.AAC.21
MTISKICIGRDQIENASTAKFRFLRIAQREDKKRASVVPAISSVCASFFPSVKHHDFLLPASALLRARRAQLLPEAARARAAGRRQRAVRQGEPGQDVVARELLREREAGQRGDHAAAAHPARRQERGGGAVPGAHGELRGQSARGDWRAHGGRPRDHHQRVLGRAHQGAQPVHGGRQQEGHARGEVGVPGDAAGDRRHQRAVIWRERGGMGAGSFAFTIGAFVPQR